MKRTLKLISKATLVVAAAFIVLSLCSWTRTPLSYSQWANLSSYFNLNAVYASGNTYHFNSYDICRNTWQSHRFNDNEYFGTVLGQNVMLRSRPIVTQSTVIGSVNTGDRLYIPGYTEYSNGRLWNKVRVDSGRSSGYWGYVCADYIIEQEKYQVLRNYVFSANSNISIKSDSKYLNAIAEILLRLNVNNYRPYLSVNLVGSRQFGNQNIQIFRIRNLGINDNDTLLAYVQFTQGSNDYTVIGIVPGQNPHSISQRYDGSFDISFYI
jgi:hypothetical protein